MGYQYVEDSFFYSKDYDRHFLRRIVGTGSLISDSLIQDLIRNHKSIIHAKSYDVSVFDYFISVVRLWVNG